jgi:hypothetical protein
VKKSFYKDLPSFSNFDEVIENERFHALPDDWIVGVSDVINSTGAIAEGRYKMVNMAGASVISAVMNALDGLPFPFVFGGDGAGFAVPGSFRNRTEKVLAACQVWSSEEIGLSLRAAVVPVLPIRQAGHDVTVARFQASTEIGYAMFSGGGMAWAEAQMKSGTYGVAAAPPGTRPDLTGLSCRFRPLKARNGEILSLLVLPVKSGTAESFAALVSDVLNILERATDRQGHPVAPEGPRFVWPPQGINIETRTPGTGQKGRSRLSILLEHLVPWLLQLTGTRMKRFDPAAYRRDTAGNTDFRKFDDGLKLTVDCPAETIDDLEKLLAAAQMAGVARYGLHRQDSALMTCIVPSAFTRDHIHFVDGAAGGYAKAAEMLKKAL